MNTKKFLKLFALISVFALLLCACGAREEAPGAEQSGVSAEAVTGELGLSDWSLTATIWSSANGASIDLTAVPTTYVEGMTATFVVRLEGEDVVSNPCEWNGTAFTSYADLNAEDGYCYYVMLSDDTHTVTLDVNTPTAPYDDSLIDLAASLESYCTVVISDAVYEGGVLSIVEGTAQIQPPRITDDGKAITVTEAKLILNLDGGALSQKVLDLPAELNEAGGYTVNLENVSFSVPSMEGDHQITLTLSAELSDGLILEDADATSWFYSGGTVNLTVG